MTGPLFLSLLATSQASNVGINNAKCAFESLSEAMWAASSGDTLYVGASHDDDDSYPPTGDFTVVAATSDCTEAQTGSTASDGPVITLEKNISRSADTLEIYDVNFTAGDGTGVAKVQGGHISFRRSTLSGGEWTLLADPTVTTSTVQFKVFDSIIEGGAAVGSGVAAAVEVRGGAMRMDDTVVSDHSGVVLRMTNGGTLIHNGGSVSSNTSSSAIIEVDTGHLTSYEVDHTDNTAENLIHFIGPLAGSTPSITGQLTFSSYTDNDINNATILSEGHTVEITANESVFARNNAAAEVDLTVGTTVNLNGVLMDDGISVGVTGQGGEVITGCSTSCTEIIATSPLSVVSMGVETNSSKFVGSSNFQDSQLVSSSTLFDGALNLLNGTDASLSGVTVPLRRLRLSLIHI